jgi:type IV secretory pathway VirJ component
MLKRYWRRVLLVMALILLGVAVLLWNRPANPARVVHKTLADGSSLSLATALGAATARVLLVNPSDQLLTDDDLLELAEDSGARIVQISLPATCSAQQVRSQAAIALLGQPTLVAGIGSGAAFAWRWLAEQSSDNAQALSIGFSLKQADCAQALPDKALHGKWNIAWNDNPDDDSARFAREQSNAQTSISDYSSSLSELLKDGLEQALSGAAQPMPVVEVSQQESADTVTLFYSGDGGWRDLDRDVAEQMAKRGYPVVGIDALRYFWQHKSPAQAAEDLSNLMQEYRTEWQAKRFVLAGFSFGADALPAIYNQLPSTDQQQVDAILLLALGRSGSFQIEVQGWLGQAGQEAATGPELAKLPADKVLCVYGSEEADSSGCTQSSAVGEMLELPGGHHYDENYPALAEKLLKAIEKRQPDKSIN